jgi:Tfp pilus assembly protein PilF
MNTRLIKIKAQLEHLQQLKDDEQYDQALKELVNIPEEERSSEMWVLYGQLIQLAGDSGNIPLSEVERSYEKAMLLSPQNPVPMIEMGWYLFAVKDDAKLAKPYFEKALALIAKEQRMALWGYARCVEELESLLEAQKTVRNYPTSKEIKSEILEILDYFLK